MYIFLNKNPATDTAVKLLLFLERPLPIHLRGQKWEGRDNSAWEEEKVQTTMKMKKICTY